VVVQPVHMVPAEEFHDLASLVRGLAAIRGMQAHSRPFAALALGRPALGGCDPRHPASADIRRVAVALAADADQARRERAALVYMAHGSRHFPVGGLYLEFAACMRELYPEVRTLVGTIDSFPSLDPVVTELHGHGAERVLLKPLLIASGLHAARDLAGPGADSWQSRLTAAGCTTLVEPAGLGEQPAFCQVLVEHIAETAAAAGLELA
jgi:sirohydrochlorin cobaltochelatase